MKTAITCFIIFFASLMVLWSGHNIIAGITAALSATIGTLSALFTNTK